MSNGNFVLPVLPQAISAAASLHIAQLWRGRAQLIPRQQCMRCTMVNRAQPNLDTDLNIFKTLHRTHGGKAGMWTQVKQPGLISEGDVVEIA